MTLPFGAAAVNRPSPHGVDVTGITAMHVARRGVPCAVLFRAHDLQAPPPIVATGVLAYDGAPAVEGHPVDNHGRQVDLTLAYVRRLVAAGGSFLVPTMAR